MSVDKIAPLSQTSIDALAARANSPAAPTPSVSPFPARPAPAPAPEAGTHGNFFESLTLPLPSAAPRSGTQIATPAASYAREAAGMEIPALVDGRLPQQVLTRAIATLLRDAANARETTVPRIIDETDVTKGPRLPSRNGLDAEYALRASLFARDEGDEPAPIDLYLTRVGARQWEAAVYRRDESSADPGFPYTTATINVERLVIDPSNGHILACVAQQIVPHKLAQRLETRTLELILATRSVMLAVAVIATAIILAKTLSRLVAIGFVVTAVALAIRIPGETKRRAKGLTRSRQRRS